jgi:hypothetical protein
MCCPRRSRAMGQSGIHTLCPWTTGLWVRACPQSCFPADIKKGRLQYRANCCHGTSGSSTRRATANSTTRREPAVSRAQAEGRQQGVFASKAPRRRRHRTSASTKRRASGSGRRPPRVVEVPREPGEVHRRAGGRRAGGLEESEDRGHRPRAWTTCCTAARRTAGNDGWTRRRRSSFRYTQDKRRQGTTKWLTGSMGARLSSESPASAGATPRPCCWWRSCTPC